MAPSSSCENLSNNPSREVALIGQTSVRLLVHSVRELNAAVKTAVVSFPSES